MGKLFAGSNSSSKNLSYPVISSDFGGTAGQIGDVSGGLGKILGVGTANPLQSFYNEGGGNFLLNQGLQGLTNKFSAMGMLGSGAAMKSMEQYRSGLASNFLNDYLGQLQGLGKLDLGAGGLISDAGQVSKGNSSNGGLGSLIGSVLASGKLG